MLPTTTRLQPLQIDLEVTDRKHRRQYPHRPTKQGAQPRAQFAEGKRLGQIVVRAGIESADPVVHRVA